MKFTIVTPSYNQGRFIERTILSVLSQAGDFDLEYIVMDGGSTDETRAILQRYADRLTYTSAPDGGQADAINRGLAAAKGEVLGWLNSDDIYEPGALQEVARAMTESGRRWCFGQCTIINEDDLEIHRPISWYKNYLSRRYTSSRLIAKEFIPQPATFFRRDIWTEVGELDRSLNFALDYDLWLRFARRSPPRFIPRNLARFRWHPSSKSTTERWRSAWQAFQVARRQAGPHERLAVAEHCFHAFSRVAGYQLLRLVE